MCEIPDGGMASIIQRGDGPLVVGEIPFPSAEG
jgi:hypothetical protein